ncbi:hypothetical protein HYDPIDRAFT_187936 [Hydnomerulius pinastri MD-312]|uniref:Uncharacterized protein n=1 Tax=Hydnomerulius pinastri MD-312 TaxID=994086 RepID=A0A0C9WG12_9AGAM|nr:hypothetical protein HYDPIDRAFT_187936 [Hydnomerulius pinastri MD-312]
MPQGRGAVLVAWWWGMVGGGDIYRPAEQVYALFCVRFNLRIFLFKAGLVKHGAVDEHETTVPWTITNKYYTADVQFIVHELSTWVPNQEELEGVPAVLFIWTDGEPYKDKVLKLSRQLLPHEFEVALAIRLPSGNPASPADSEDEQDIDGYLSSQGFEFVDVMDSDVSPPASDRSGIPGVPRIIDALSTIMWPSMVQHTSKQESTQGFIGMMREDNVGPSNGPDDLAGLIGAKLSGGDKDRIRRELEELERWLDEDTPAADADARSSDGDSDIDPWSTAVTPGTTTPYATSDVHTSSRPSTPTPGFDDDFTAFVSASPLSSTGAPQGSSQSSTSPRRFPPLASTSFSSTFSFDSASSGRSTPTVDENASFDTSQLTPGDMGFGVSYRSLGSMSDFGDMDGETAYNECAGDSEDDEDLPSKAEIAATSHRIFGSQPLSISPTQGRSSQSLQTHAAPSTVATETAQIATQGGPDKEDFGAKATDEDLERFDLQSMLGALQGLKEDIAGMPDKERRKAAARVALGLVYGLDKKTAGN